VWDGRSVSAGCAELCASELLQVALELALVAVADRRGVRVRVDRLAAERVEAVAQDPEVDLRLEPPRPHVALLSLGGAEAGDPDVAGEVRRGPRRGVGDRGRAEILPAPGILDGLLRLRRGDGLVGGAEAALLLRTAGGGADDGTDDETPNQRKLLH
jgi:hypothetical protein